MKIRGLGRAKRLAYRLSLPFRSRAVILVYHRVFQPTSDPQLLCVRPERFGQHLEHLSRHYSVLSLDQLALALQEQRLPDHAVVVTFDDGYADNLYHALPLLESYATPAMVAVTTGYMGQAKEFWWDELERLLLLSPRMPAQLQVVVDGAACSWCMDEDTRPIDDDWNVTLPDHPTPRQRAYRDLHSLLRPLRFDAQQSVLADLRDQLGDAGQARSGYLALSPDEVRRLAAAGLVDIASHTVSHPVLSGQPPDFQRYELVESKRQLEALLGRPVNTLVYSYGARTDAGNETALLARQAGYQIGCANFPALVTNQSDVFQLPRFLVRDWDGHEFARQLARWFRG